MQDSVIKGTGNSRYLKSVENLLTLYPTYEDFAQALVEGTLPIDLNGVNTSGWQTVGTSLNKSNLLTDATAALYGKTSTATPNTIFAAIRPLITAAQTSADGKAKIEVGTYTGTGTYGEGNKNELTFSILPKFGIIFLSGYTMHISVDGLYSYVTLAAGQSSSSREIKVSVSGNTISWYSTDNAAYQMNVKDSYYYIFFR